MPRQNRGEVWLVDLGMVAKVRPCLVISIPVLVRDRALVTVVTHTTSTRGSRFEIPIKTRFLDRIPVFSMHKVWAQSQKRSS